MLEFASRLNYMYRTERFGTRKAIFSGEARMVGLKIRANNRHELLIHRNFGRLVCI